MSLNKNEVTNLLKNVVGEFSRRLTLVEMTVHDLIQFIDNKYGKKDTAKKEPVKKQKSVEPKK